MTRAAMWVAFVMGVVLFAAAGFLVWLEYQGRLPEPWPGLTIGCLMSGVFSFFMAAVGAVTRD
jgi:hypothetical protein